MYLDIVQRIVKHQMEEFTGAAGVKLLDLKQVSSFTPAQSQWSVGVHAATGAK